MIIEFIFNNPVLIILIITNIILLILYLNMFKKLTNLRKSYMEFMSKLGNGNNLEEMLKQYINKVVELEHKDTQILNYCQKLDNDMKGCLKKIGIVRYNAFKDTGSDLSFSIAMLDENNNGVILNSVYGRDTSNIYAKSVKQGNVEYVLSEEEREALNIAINK